MYRAGDYMKTYLFGSYRHGAYNCFILCVFSIFLILGMYLCDAYLYGEHTYLNCIFNNSVSSYITLTYTCIPYLLCFLARFSKILKIACVFFLAFKCFLLGFYIFFIIQSASFINALSYIYTDLFSTLVFTYSICSSLNFDARQKYRSAKDVARCFLEMLVFPSSLIINYYF